MKHSDIEEAGTETFSYVEKEKGNPLSFTTGCKELLEKNLHDTIDMTPSPVWKSIASGQYLSQLHRTFDKLCHLWRASVFVKLIHYVPIMLFFSALIFSRTKAFWSSMDLNGSNGTVTTLRTFSCFSLPCLPETSHHHLSVKGVDNLRPDFPMHVSHEQLYKNQARRKPIYTRQVIKLHAITLHKTSNIVDSNSYSPISAIMAWIHINIKGCFWVTTSGNHYEN